MRSYRRLTVGLATVAVAGLIAVTPAHAETDAIRRAEAELAQIQEESSKIDSDYANAQAALEDAKAKLAQADVDIVTQTAKVAELKSGLSQLALMQYQSNGVNLTAQLLASPDETSFLNSLARIDSVTQRANSNIQDVQLEQAKLDRLRADAASYTAVMEAEQKKQADLVKQFDEKERRAQAVLDGLKAEERARLLAAREEQTQQASRAANGGRQAIGESPQQPTPEADPGSATGSSRAAAAVEWARTQVGKRYIFGSTGPGGYDCSGLTTAAYARVGVSLPRTSQTQFRVGTPVSKSDLRVGDLLFFYNGITHVGLYAGNGVMVHSSPSGRGVHYSKLATYPAYKGARRVA
ncbi:MAG: NlpC/P60 family protein [Propionibacteriaceae bacterium]|nr:NlpC/P60 family protein [Propionibacteriaceae bacterium]